MDRTYHAIKDYLNDPSQLEVIWDSSAIIWVDWREYDEDIVAYFNEAIDNEIQVQLEDHGKEYGNDIFMTYEDQTMMIPYGEQMERDITITSVNGLLAPDHQIRWFMESLGNDTLGFVLLSHEEWGRLEAEFGRERLEYYFLPVEMGMNMFNLDFDEATEILILREKNPLINPKIIMDYVHLAARDGKLKGQKQKGEIDLATYAKEKKSIKQQREDMVREHRIRQD